MEQERAPAQWNALLAPGVPWNTAYAAVATTAARFLDSRPGETFTTNEVVEELYPEQFARGDGIAARKRMFKALAALAEHGLQLYCTRGEPRPLRHSKKMVRPWVWHAAELSQFKVGDEITKDGARWRCISVEP